MLWLDRGLSVLLILGGIGHTWGVTHYYTNPDTLFWSLTASLLIALIAAINLLRTWRPRDRAVAGVAASASAAYFAVTLCFGQLVGNVADPRVILFGVITLGLTVFGVRDALRH